MIKLLDNQNVKLTEEKDTKLKNAERESTKVIRDLKSQLDQLKLKDHQEKIGAKPVARASVKIEGVPLPAKKVQRGLIKTKKL